MAGRRRFPGLAGCLRCCGISECPPTRPWRGAGRCRGRVQCGHGSQALLRAPGPLERAAVCRRVTAEERRGGAPSRRCSQRRPLGGERGAPMRSFDLGCSVGCLQLSEVLKPCMVANHCQAVRRYQHWQRWLVVETKLSGHTSPSPLLPIPSDSCSITLPVQNPTDSSQQCLCQVLAMQCCPKL